MSSHIATAQAPARRVEAPTPLVLENGKILEHVPCTQHPEQSYALYLPTNYSAARQWPIVYSFDPAARGTVPIELQKEAAEHHGYILAASDNSRNGPWKVEFDAADAMFRDTHERVAIDDRAVYFAGFSGGARVASQLALVCKCATGVLLSGAGFPVSAAPSRDVVFEVFSAVGTLEFNYQEVVPLQDKLVRAGYPHWLYLYEGSHQWAPAEAMEQALAWFRVQAMKARRQTVDNAFLASQFSKAIAQANSTEQSGDLLNAWREYLQIVATFDGLADISGLRVKADSLGGEKSVRGAAKQERSDFDEQLRLSGGVLSGLPVPIEASDSSSGPPRAAEVRARALRRRAKQEKRADRARVHDRPLAGVFVGAMESGETYLENHSYPRATRAFACATEARPDSEWAWRNLAVAAALNADRKESLAALKHAGEVATDKAALLTWAKTEAGFDRIRPTPEFQAFLNSPAP